MEHKQTVTEVKESRLSIKQKVLFGMGDYLNTITYGMISAFLMAFLTDTLLPHGSSHRHYVPVQALGRH